MSTVRNNIGRFFEAQTRWIYKNRIKTLAVIAMFVAALASNLPNITLDTSMEGFLHEDDPIIKTYNSFRNQFGRDEMIVIAINPPDVFDIGFLEKLKQFHNELENEVPHLNDITSMINARNTRGEGDELIVEDLLENFPENEKDLAALKMRVLSNPTYQNTLISEDGTFTTVLIKTDVYSSSGVLEDVMAGFDEPDSAARETDNTDREFLSDAENTEIVNAVKSIVARYDSPGFPIMLSGSPVVTSDLKYLMRNDMRRFILFATLIIGAVLFILFRRVTGVILPMIVVILSLISAVSLMSIFSVSIKMPTMILPSFLLAVGVGDSVHVLALFYRQFALTGDKESSIAYAMGHSGLAIVMTSLTTAAGLLSFAWAEVAPVADLGRFSSAGVMLALLYTISLLPALISIIPIKVKTGDREKKRQATMDRILVSIADFSTGSPKKIIAASAVMVIVSILLIFNVRFSHTPLKWFPEEMETRRATELLDDKLKGTTTIEIIFDTGKENGLYSPEFLNKLDNLGAELLKTRHGDLFIGKTLALPDIVKEINKALNENREEFYAIPQDRELVAQELLLFENSGSDDLEDFVDSQFSKTRMTVKLPWLDAYEYGKFLGPLEERLNETFKNEAQVTITGMIPIFSRTLSAAMTSTAKSYLIAVFVITIMMILLLGDIKIGLLSMIPNLMPIVMTIGLMGALDFPMDMFTMLIGAIAIGLAVDDTVHFMSNFKRYYEESGNAPQAVRDTLLTTGRAMMVTTIVLSLGFFIFMLASMNSWFNFGLLTGITIIMALIADFFLAPAIMTLVTRHDSAKATDGGSK